MAINTNIKDLRPARERYSKTETLLSKGWADRTAFPEGKIKIFPWDSSTDDWITKRIRKGNAQGRSILFQILPFVTDLNGCLPGKFIASEVLSILMISRALLRNDKVVIQPKCPACGHTSVEHVEIPGNLEKIGEKTDMYTGTDLVLLPDCKDKVEVKMLTIDDELLVLDRGKTNKNVQIVDHVARVFEGIVSVNGGKPDSVQELANWFQALHPSDTEYLLQNFNLIQPHLSPKLEFSCDECNKEFSYVLSLDEDFFRELSISGY